MAESRPLFIGPRLKRLRRELGLTQQAMADDLEISASYVALLERNQRPMTADLLLRLARTYRMEVADLAAEDGEAYARRINDVLRDPIFADIDLPPLEVADLATSFPGVSEALLRLHGAYVREQQALAEQRVSGGNESDPSQDAQRFMSDRGNYFDQIDRSAEKLAEEIEDAGGPRHWVQKQGIRVRFLPPDVMIDSLRRFDRHNQQLLIDDSLDAAGRSWELASHIAYSALRKEIGQTVREAQLEDKAADTLVRGGLGEYAAKALLMPYSRFAREADRRRYDVQSLANHFGTSFHLAAERLTTLRRPGDERIPFFLIRVDEAGNISRRLDGTGLSFAAHGGGCPLWNVHGAFRRPNDLLCQQLELPDGQRFFSVARTVTKGDANHARQGVMQAVALVCAAEHADKLCYSQETGAGSIATTPIGVTCRLCHRAECTARSAPPIGRDILPEDYRAAPQPFLFSES